MPDGLIGHPIGIHFIRQSDSLAFVQYYLLGLGSLLEPGTLDMNIAPVNGRTAGEFPITYWIMAWLAKASGVSSNGLRVLHLILLLSGLVVFTKAAWRVLRSSWLAIGSGLWIMGAPVLIYYGCNFLPDSAALGLTLWAWGLVLPSLCAAQPQLPWPSLILFTLAGLIKAPMAMNLMAVALASVFLLLCDRPPHWRRSSFRIALMTIGGLVVIVSWHLHAIQYNQVNQAGYFLTSAAPLWNMTGAEQRLTVDLIWRYWWGKYLHPTTWHGLAIILGVALFNCRRVGKGIMLALVFLGFGSVAFILLFFQKLADHDYYFLTLIPFIALLILAGLRAMEEVLWKAWQRSVLLVGVWVLAIASHLLASVELQRRTMASGDGFSRTGLAMDSFRDGLGASDLPLTAKVIVLGDSTPNGALARLGRQGWSYPGYPIASVPRIEALMDNGATHVLVIAPDSLPLWPVSHVISNGSCSLWRLTR